MLNLLGPASPHAPTGPGTASTEPHPRCRNCEERLPAPTPNYCPACGQETRLRAPTLREFAQQSGGHYVATEGALWRTLKLLVTQPGELTREFINGRRRRYVLPVRLYLTISLMALVALRLGSTLQVQFDGRTNAELSAPGPRNLTVIDAGRHRAGLQAGHFYCEALPGWLCTRLQRRFDVAPEVFQREVQALPERFIGHWGGVMFVLVPLFAALLQLGYRRVQWRYTEHLVFALHVHAAGVLALALTALPWGWMPAYTLLAAHRVYGGSWFGQSLRLAIVLAVYGGSVVVAMVALSLWEFLA